MGRPGVWNLRSLQAAFGGRVGNLQGSAESGNVSFELRVSDSLIDLEALSLGMAFQYSDS